MRVQTPSSPGGKSSINVSSRYRYRCRGRGQVEGHSGRCVSHAANGAGNVFSSGFGFGFEVWHCVAVFSLSSQTASERILLTSATHSPGWLQLSEMCSWLERYLEYNFEIVPISAVLGLVSWNGKWKLKNLIYNMSLIRYQLSFSTYIYHLSRQLLITIFRFMEPSLARSAASSRIVRPTGSRSSSFCCNFCQWFGNAFSADCAITCFPRGCPSYT